MGRLIARACFAGAVPIAGLLLAASAGAATLLVLPGGGGDHPTLQAAVDAAAGGDTILLGDGLFQGAGNRDIDPAGKALIIASQSRQPSLCILDCEGAAGDPHRAFHFHSGEGPETVVEHLTLRHGYGHDDPYGLSEAGAVLCADASPTLRGCIFEANQAVFGGAILLTGAAAPLLTHCSFLANQAVLDGAGLCCREASAPTVRDCLFSGNIAGSRAAGLLADDTSAPQVIDCTFRDNLADYGGGGVYCCGTSTATIRDCTFVGNGGGANGAGIAAACHADTQVEAVIIAYSVSGPAVDYLNNAEVTLRCCDLFGNAGGDWVGPVLPQYGIEGNFWDDPLFCDLELGDLRLHTDSACLPRNHPTGAECGVIGAWPVGCPSTGVDPSPRATAVRLAPARPNPTISGVDLLFTAPGPHAADLRLVILDAAGRRIRLLREGLVAPGDHALRWDGADDAGRPVAAGLYLVRLDCGAEVRATSLLKLR